MYLWIYSAFLAMIISAILIIFMKFIDNSNYDNTIFLLFSLIILGKLAFLCFFLNKSTYLKKCKKYDYKFMILVSFFALFLFINNFCLQYAIKISPNTGYTHLIVNFNVIFTILASYFLFKEKINYKTFIGIIITLIGFSIIAYNFD